jgi:hypothetical protein
MRVPPLLISLGLRTLSRNEGVQVAEQTLQALHNCTAMVEAGGGTLADVVQVTVLLTNPSDFAGMNEAYSQVFTAQPPARAVAKLGVELPNEAGTLQRAASELRHQLAEDVGSSHPPRLPSRSVGPTIPPTRSH